METYKINYSCGCIHEIIEENGRHQPTNKNIFCDEHKKVEL